MEIQIPLLERINVYYKKLNRRKLKCLIKNVAYSGTHVTVICNSTDLKSVPGLWNVTRLNINQEIRGVTGYVVFINITERQLVETALPIAGSGNSFVAIVDLVEDCDNSAFQRP